MEDGESIDMFEPPGIAIEYAWNSSPIDGTDILRSIVAVRHEFRFSNLIMLIKKTSVVSYNSISDNLLHRCFPFFVLVLVLLK